MSIDVRGHVFAVQPVAVEWKLDPVHLPALLEAEAKVEILCHEKRLVVKAELDQPLLSEHDTASGRSLCAVYALEVLLMLVDCEVIAGHRIHVRIQLEVERQHPYEILMDVVVGIDPHDEAGVRELQSAVQGCR